MSEKHQNREECAENSSLWNRVCDGQKEFQKGAQRVRKHMDGIEKKPPAGREVRLSLLWHMIWTI
jgi:hypothetical protein